MANLTERQAEILEHIKNAPTFAKAAEAAGITMRRFFKQLAAIRAAGVEIPEAGSAYIRDTHQIGKVITHVKYTGKIGEIKNEWISSNPRAEDLERFVSNLEKRVAGKAKKIKAPQYRNTDTSIWIPMGDPHFGMYSWGMETGEDYDVDIAVSIHNAAIQKLLDSYTKVDCIYICSLGDLLHADNRRQMTEKSGHLLDVDGRYWRVVDMTTEALCRAIEFAATKAKQVKVILIDGNHDPHSSGHIARTLESYYKNVRHIEIDTRPTKHRYEVYGNNLIGLVHGDTTRSLASLPSVMSCDMREDWGRTHNHYWYTGHIHQQKVFEYPSCVVESFNSMTAKDAYAAEHGYRSRRQMTAIEIHREHGEIGRRVVRAEHFK